MSRTFTFFLTIAVVCLAVFLGSCKKPSAQEKPRQFDPTVDGIAVLPLPVLDLKSAEKVLRDGPVSPTASIMEEPLLDSADATSVPYDAGPSTAYGDDNAPAATGDENAEFDPNRF